MMELKNKYFEALGEPAPSSPFGLIDKYRFNLAASKLEPGSVLDVGAYFGDFLNKILSKNPNREVYGTEVNEKRKKIAAALLNRIKKEFKYIAFNLSPFIVDVQPYIWAGLESSIRYTYLLPLDNLQQCWENMDHALRAGIKKAKKDGLIVKQVDDFKILFKLVKKTFTRQSSILHWGRFAKKMDAKLAIAKKRIIFITYQGDIPIGGIYIIFDNKRSYYILGGYDTNKSHYGASAYALWEAIKYTKNQLLLNEFDFEGSMAQQIEHFFRQFAVS